MSANEEIFDREVGHQVNVLGFSSSVVRKVIALLNRADPDLMDQVRRATERLPRAQFTAERLDSLLIEMRAVNSQAYSEVSRLINAELRGMSGAEIDFQASTLAATVPVQPVILSAEQVYAATMARPFQGKLLVEWMSELEEDKAALIRNAVRMGYIEGETTDQIVRRIRGTRSQKYADGLLEITRRNAQAIVRTAVQHTSSFAAQRMYEENSDIIKAVRYTSVLDTRTTAICRARSGKVFPLGEKRPAIPAHINCRSRYVPVTKSFREMGIDIDEIAPSTQASLDGQVPEELTYQDWLKKQSKDMQEEILGVTKAKLFREGGLDLDRFVDRQGREYTLDELRQKDAEVFRRVGI